MPDPSGTLAALAERVRGGPKEVTVFGPGPADDPPAILAQFDVEVSMRSLPIPADAAYLTVSDGETVLGSIPLSALDAFGGPASGDFPRDDTTEPTSDLVTLLRETAFRTTDRRQLLATAREFEDRAYRVGRGALHVGFQSLSALRAQRPVYERLAADTDLDVTVYGEPDWLPDDSLDVTVRTDSGGELGSYWIVAFAAERDADCCALVAEETDPGSYIGGWTYDPALVRDLAASLSALGDEWDERNG